MNHLQFMLCQYNLLLLVKIINTKRIIIIFLNLFSDIPLFLIVGEQDVKITEKMQIKIIL